MVPYWGDGGSDSKQVLSSAFRHLPLLAGAHTLAHPPMAESALFTNLDRPPSLDIVDMTGTEIYTELHEPGSGTVSQIRQTRCPANLLIQ